MTTINQVGLIGDFQDFLNTINKNAKSYYYNSRLIYVIVNRCFEFIFPKDSDKPNFVLRIGSFYNYSSMDKIKLSDERSTQKYFIYGVQTDIMYNNSKNIFRYTHESYSTIESILKAIYYDKKED